MDFNFNEYPVPVLDNADFGKYIAKTMYLLTAGTKEKPNKIKIAFTGQSITDPNNTWTVGLTEWLRGKYPSAEIVYKNFAIGGFSTNFLYKRMPNDMASFYPDLVVCYDMGSHIYYDRMIKYIRENTTAEIMIQTEHYTQEHEWSDTMSYQHLPEIAGKYNAQICDIRTPWKNYIINNNLDVNVLLSDGTHLNENGQKFMLELMKQFFVCREESAKPAKEYLDNMYIPVNPKDWSGNKLSLPFFGNRIEIIGDIKHKISVFIDGIKPSGIKEAYIRTSENTSISTRMGIINYKKPPLEQIFTVTIKSFDDEKNFVYTAEGSETGFEGISDEHGILDGNYLYMTDESFIFHPAVENPAPGQQYTFQSIFNGTDFYDGSNPYENHKEKKELFDDNMLISGIPVGEHMLELEAESEIPEIQAVKIYNPGNCRY